MLPPLPSSGTLSRALSEASDTVTGAVSAITTTGMEAAMTGASAIAASGASMAKSGMHMAASGVKAATCFVESMYETPREKTAMFHFGKPIEECVLEDVGGYEAPIPSILIWLHEWLQAANGMSQKGIFRTSADAAMLARFQTLLANTADLSEVRLEGGMARDGRLFASTIKVWLRSLPSGLLNSVDPERLRMLDARSMADTFARMSSQHRAVLLWVLDLFVAVVRAGDTTLMTRKAAAILLAPNLLTMAPGMDPGTHLVRIKVATAFVESALLWRMGSVF